MSKGRRINKILLHCADTPTGKDFRVKDIDRWHEERGFEKSSNGKFCGYHWVICIDGVIESGRSEADIGAHCKGHNSDSIGVCLIGRGQYTDDQWISLFYLLSQLCDGYDLEAKQVFGHYEFNSQKACPMLDMNKLRDDLEIHIRGKNGTASRA